MPGVSGLARCLSPGDELPVSRVMTNSLFRIPGHFVFLTRMDGFKSKSEDLAAGGGEGCNMQRSQKEFVICDW